MPFRKFNSTLSVMAGLMFSATILLPCLCAAAVDAEDEALGEDEASSCCPERAEESPEDEQGDDCCCEGPMAQTSGDELVAHTGQTALTSSCEDDVESPNTWWTPDLVATLWLVDRLATTELPLPSVDVSSTHHRPDRSATYLEHANLLL